MEVSLEKNEMKGEQMATGGWVVQFLSQSSPFSAVSMSNQLTTSTTHVDGKCAVIYDADVVDNSSVANCDNPLHIGRSLQALHSFHETIHGVWYCHPGASDLSACPQRSSVKA